MKRYVVRLLPEAEHDILRSFEWGVKNWGKSQAENWMIGLYRTIKKKLSTFPQRCPVARESLEYDADVRQLILGRYRVLFLIDGSTVRVLHVHGSYVGAVNDEREEEVE